MNVIGDSHDLPHTVEAVQPLCGTAGWAILWEISHDRRHAQLVLAAGEGANREGLGCWTFHEGEDPDDLGLPWIQVVAMLSHVSHHVASGIPPRECVG